MFDTVIRGGDLIDGTGSRRRRMDVGIKDGRVVSIGRIDTDAAQTVDATNRVVSPGFIDVHTHYDAQLFWDPWLTPSCLHGVTTVLAGNCGFSIAPLGTDVEDRDYLVRMLARVEGMSLPALRAAVPWNWDSMADYLDSVEGSVGPNIGFMVGHSAIRRAVMGAESSLASPSEDQLREMERHLRASLDAGALGFSSSYSSAHFDGESQPVPSRNAEREELLRLARVVREYEGTSLEFIPCNGPFSPEAIELVGDLSMAAMRPLNWNILHVTAATFEQVEQKLEVSDAARRKGARVVALTCPISSPVRFDMISGTGLETIPGWTEVMGLPIDQKLAFFNDRADRARLAELAKVSSGLVSVDWANYVIWDTYAPQNEQYRRQVIGEIARVEGRDPWDVLCDIVVADGLKTGFGPPLRQDSAEDWAARASVWRDGRAVIGASDAGAHIDTLCTFNYPTAMLSAVRDNDVLPLEEAIRLLTTVPAELYGIRDRGVVAEGAWADIVVFDPERISSGVADMRYDLPAGGGRLYAEAQAIDHVLVNGTSLVQHGEIANTRPGYVLRAGQDTATPSLD
jgi:N-acyl-D-aspartate/D-glutamate deacylase